MRTNRLFLLIFGSVTSIALQANAQNPVPGLQDLVGARGSSGETQLEQRGYQFVRTAKSGRNSYSYWKENGTGKCVSVRTENGRYQALVYTPNANCKSNNASESSSNNGSSNNGNRSIKCKFNGQPKTCQVKLFDSQAGTLVEVTFPDGFTRKMTFSSGDFFSEGLEVQTNLRNGIFFVTNDNKESFEIPRAWFDR